MYDAGAYVGIAIWCLACALVIVGYGTWRCKHPEFTDPLTRPMVGGRRMASYTDGWGLTHMTFFALMTYMYPAQAVELFVVGVVWELIESAVKDRPFYLSKCHVRVGTDAASQAGWWYGRWQDIVMNTLGQVMGYALWTLKAPWWTFVGFYTVIVGGAFVRAA